MPRGGIHRSIDARFWSKVDQSGDCWLWTGVTLHSGYGQAWHEGRRWLAHRLAYWLRHGVLPPLLDHRCGVRACVNPEHLRPLSQRANLLASPLTWASRNRAKTQCPRGHPYTAANTYRDPRGSRVCRTCIRERQRQRRS